MAKEYLGDSVYAESDEFGVVLTTENGYGPSNTIYLEPEVIRALLRYIERLKGQADTGISRDAIPGH